MSLFKTNDYSKPKCVKAIKDRMIRDIKTLFRQENDYYKPINFISSKDIDGERVMHSKSDNIEFMAYDNAN